MNREETGLVSAKDVRSVFAQLGYNHKDARKELIDNVFSVLTDKMREKNDIDLPEFTSFIALRLMKTEDARAQFEVPHDLFLSYCTSS